METRLKVLWPANNFVASKGLQGINNLEVYMWLAFGDESSFPDGLATYAIIGVWSGNQTVSEKSFRQLKLSFGGKPNSKIHCRELFNIHARNKSDWAHLSEKDVFEFLLALTRLSHQLELRRNVGFVDGKLAPKSLAGVGSIDAHCELTEKHLCTFAFAAVAAQVFQQIGPNAVKFWIDPDKTKIDWWGKNRQAGLTREVTALDFDMAKVKPETSPLADRIFLDLADILAYVSGKTRTESDPERKKLFTQMMEIWSPGIVEHESWTDT